MSARRSKSGTVGGVGSVSIPRWLVRRIAAWRWTLAPAVLEALLESIRGRRNGSVGPPGIKVAPDLFGPRQCALSAGRMGEFVELIGCGADAGVESVDASSNVGSGRATGAHQRGQVMG